MNEQNFCYWLQGFVELNGSAPVRSPEGQWTWQSQNVRTGKIIDYLVTEGMSHYSSNLYGYKAYEVKHWV